MKSFTVFSAASVFVIFLTLLVTSWASAQGGVTAWTEPYQISSKFGQVGDPVIFADTFGYVHLFWSETGLLEHQTVLYYSRFDGEIWTLPVDILIAPAATRVSATVDLEGVLYLLFTNEGSGAVYFTKASIQDAISAEGWESPEQLSISVQWIAFRVDSSGDYHLLYSNYDLNEPGVYYTRSVDEGQSWSRSVWLDSDIPADLAPTQIKLELGEGDSLHASWFYWDQNFLGRWIRYANSLDKGINWSTPVTIDKVEAGSEELRLPSPALAVHGGDVHMIWAGDNQTHRKHRVSQDSGQTWNQAKFVFGDLHGQAIGDGLAFDSLGRLHFFGQIRWPQGIYHVHWGQGRWSSPFIIYLIAQGDSELRGERIHAHRVRAAIRSGNQVVVTFTTSPEDPESILYVMHMTLPDVPAVATLSLLGKTLEPEFESEVSVFSPTSSPETPTEISVLTSTLDPNSSSINSPSSVLIWGILPAILLVAGVLIGRFLFRKDV